MLATKTEELCPQKQEEGEKGLLRRPGKTSRLCLPALTLNKKFIKNYKRANPSSPNSFLNESLIESPTGSSVHVPLTPSWDASGRGCRCFAPQTASWEGKRQMLTERGR